MAKKTVLIIDESPLFRDYVSSKLEALGILVVKSDNGVDGGAKLTQYRPQLVIADYALPQRPLVSILKSKNLDVSVASTPFIVCSGKLNGDKVVELNQLGVRKIFMKPLKIDQFWQAVGEVLGQKIVLDESPCILDAHVNETVIFIEVALGLNLEKIHLLEFKLHELMELHSITIPKILVMLSTIDIKEPDLPKVQRLFEILVSLTRGRVKWIKVLTQSPLLPLMLKRTWEFSEIGVTDNLGKALDELSEMSNVETFLQDTKSDASSTLEMRFDSDKALAELTQRMNAQGSDLRVAVVDDDFIVQEIVKNTFGPSGSQVLAFDDGGDFLNRFPDNLDILFLDLMMPRVDGFTVMERLKEKGFQTPIIVLSALSRRETVLKAMSYGIRSYITKPLKPDDLLRKTFEVVGTHF